MTIRNWVVRRLAFPATLACAVALLLVGPVSGAGGAARAADPSLRAPELDGGIGWINTDKPIRLKDLRGKVVLLDFWTLC